MRIIIETDDGDNVALKSQGQSEVNVQEKEHEYIDGGPPSEALLMALDEASRTDVDIDEEENISDDVDESVVH